MTSNYKRAVACLLLGLLPASTADVRAEKAPLSIQKLEREATHIISGTVVAVTAITQKSEIEKAAGVHLDRVYTVKLKVASVSKGEGVKTNEIVVIEAWRSKVRIPPLPGLGGHQSIPAEGDAVTVYVASKEGNTFKPLLPNGIQVKDTLHAQELKTQSEELPTADGRSLGFEIQFDTSYPKTGGLTPAGLTKAKEEIVISLARKHGLKRIERIYSYRVGSPDGPALIGVEADRKIEGGGVTCKVLKVTFKKWSEEGAEPGNDEIRIGDFWAGPAKVDRQELLKVGRQDYRACSIQGDFRNKVGQCESLLDWIREGSISLTSELSERFEGATQLSEIELFEELDTSKPDWFLTQGIADVWIQLSSKSNPESQWFLVKVETDFREATIVDVIQNSDWGGSRLIIRDFSAETKSRK